MLDWRSCRRLDSMHPIWAWIGIRNQLVVKVENNAGIVSGR